MKIFASILFLIVGGVSCAKVNSCQQSFTEINKIQGQTNNTPLAGQMVWVQGIVTADFRGKDQLGGYFIQSVQADNNTFTSEGLFVHENNLQLPLKVGDVVAVQGQVKEQFGVTQLSRAKKLRVCSSNHHLPRPVVISLPLDDLNLEALENMHVTLAKPYAISDVYPLVEFGEVVISDGMIMNPTSLHYPGQKVAKMRKMNRNNQLIIDDGRLSKFSPEFVVGSDGENKLSANNPIQLGQTLHTSGIMHYAFGDYKLQPTSPVKLGQPLLSSQIKPQEVAGNLKVASFNIENFFTTLDNGKEICGPQKNFSCRGADNSDEYQRQLDKLVRVINATDASVMGIQELENNANASIKALVKVLNHDAGEKKWAYIDTGALGQDVIKVGIIYQPNILKPKGKFALLNRQADQSFLENKNRIIVAQTFSDNDRNDFNVATVHFKSKSCRNAEGEFMDQKDGQGCYNPTRKQVAKQLAQWLDSDPTGQHAQATFVVGDFNSYQKEDPMEVLKKAGYMNLADRYLPAENWTTSYRGAVGSLDYVLANEAAQQLTKGMTQWHINSVSMDDLGYNTEDLSENLPKPENFYSPDPYASSDHDVVIVGFEF